MSFQSQKLRAVAFACLTLVSRVGLADQLEKHAPHLMDVLDLLTMHTPPSGAFVEVDADVRCDPIEFCRLIAPTQASRIIALDLALASQRMRLDLAKRCSSESCKARVSGTFAGDDVTVKEITIIDPQKPAGARRRGNRVNEK